MKTNLGRWCLATAVVAAAGCSGDPAGETIGGAQQALGAGEFALLNEIELNPPGGDAPWQYIELVGTPGASLAGLQVVVAEGAGAASVQMVVNLGVACGGACAIGTNGIFMIKTADGGSGPLGHTPAAGTAVFKDAQLSTATLNTLDTAVLLVQGPAAIAEGATLARGDGGVAVLPAGDSILDGVGWGGGGTLSGVTLAQAAGIPDAATRLRGRTDRTASAWYAGNLAGLASTVNYATPATQRTANFPAGGILTPGAPNLPLEEDAGTDAGDGAIDATIDAAPEATADVVPAADVVAEADARAPDATPDVVAVVDAAADRGADAAPDGSSSDARADAQPDAVNDRGPIDGSAEASIDDGATQDAPVSPDAAGTGGSAGAGGTGAGGSAGSGGRATGGTAGTAGSAGSGGTAGSSDAGSSDAGEVTPPAEEDGGCGCRVGSAPVGGRSAVFAAFGLAAWLRARRKRRAS